MSVLGEHLDRYLTIRRALGFKLVDARRLLNDFVTFADAAGQSTITIQIALSWANLPPATSHAYRSQRMRAVRGFARYLHGLDPSVEVPPLDLLPARKHRPTPYIYTDRDVAAVMGAACRLRPPLLAATTQTVIGLLACTGIRIGEALRLDREDIDSAHQLLLIRDSKFGKSREVLIHPGTIRALAGYAKTRERLRPDGDPRSVFISTRGTRLGRKTFTPTFHTVLRHAGLVTSGSRPPTAHDLRHTFAVNTLLRWYRHGDDVAARMPLLSTYLGHVDPAATYWYLSAAPELLGLAARRLELASDGNSRDPVALTRVPWAGQQPHRARRQQITRKGEQ